MDDKKPIPRHMVSLTKQTFRELDQYKARLEEQLKIRLSYAQAISYLINNQKESA